MLFIGSDHAGFALKTMLIDYLAAKKIPFKDVGAYSLDSVDYPDFAHAVAHGIETGAATRGILICGSGQGVAITANKHAAVRAALCWTAEIAALSREHNDANVLCLPARFINEAEAKAMVDAFLNTDFAGGRHALRVAKIAIY